MNYVENPETGCWEKQTVLSRKGYARVTRKGKKVRAHRAMWEALFGPIPEGMYVCHSCDVRNCVNPAHLWLGTVTDNNQDCLKKGRRGQTVAKGEKVRSAKLTEAAVLHIRDEGRKYLAREPFMSNRELAALYGVSVETIRKARSGENWSHVT